MANTSIDANNRNVLSAQNDDTGEIEDLYVDPVTGALLVYGVADAGGTFTDLNELGIDENGRNTLGAWNEDTEQIESLRCSDQGELLVTIV